MSDSEERHLPRWRALDDGRDVRRRVMRALRCAERLMYERYEQGDHEGALDAVTRVQQAARCYLKAMEVHSLERRVEALEERLSEPTQRTNGTH